MIFLIKNKFISVQDYKLTQFIFCMFERSLKKNFEKLKDGYNDNEE